MTNQIINNINWEHTYQVFAWDSGYDHDKVVTDNKEELISPSVTEKVPAGSFKISKNSQFAKDRMLIKYVNEEYRVGDFAINTSASGGKKNFAEDRFKSKEELVRLFALAAALNPNKAKIKINILMVGLPVATYQRYKEEIVNTFKSKLFKYSIPDSNGDYREITLYIENCNCVPQGVGMYYDYTLDLDGKAKSQDLIDRQYAVLDVGGKTVDGYISYGKNNIIPETVIPIEQGVTDAFKEVAKKLNNAPYTKVERAYISGKNKIHWNGEHQIRGVCEEEFKNLAEDIYATTHNTWVRYLPGTEFILLGGGGGAVTKKDLSYLFKNKIRLVDNPQMSNARGYLKLGIYAQSRRE